jgi:hypothetical protein
MCEGAKCLGKCNALAKATPVYVGADLSALAGAEDIIAVEQIFKSFSDSTIVIQTIQHLQQTPKPPRITQYL